MQKKKEKYLVIVESPTKAKTISGILGRNYEVASSMGHIVDLFSSKLSVDIEDNFKPQYRVILGKRKILEQIKKKAKNKNIIYLATDYDREGEAISWHLKEKLQDTSGKFLRIVFHEITEGAIKEAIAHPKGLDMNKVQAQIARRVLDRIVGYYLSPLLWRKITKGLSAGRVQSVALKFIVDREKEIKNFIPTTTYSIEAILKTPQGELAVKLDKFKGERAVFKSREEAHNCLKILEKENFTVEKVLISQTKRKPYPPYTTSLLQQDAFHHFKFSSKKTMFIAQKLYEGVSIEGKMTGLITYMRTDSFYINPKAKKEIISYIKNNFTERYLPDKEYKFKDKKSAQAAHEAIRPTFIHKNPASLKNYLETEDAKLYHLIYKRTLAAFMHEAVWENKKIIISSPLASFSLSGKRLIFDGFLKVWGKEEEEVILPDFKEKDKVIFAGFNITEHTTKPPPRYNDASLVKIMEEKGIGRPSTYAPTISTLLARGYVRRLKGSLQPTELGIKALELLEEYFSSIINEKFTAQLEEKLDEIEEGEKLWQEVLREFYPKFKQQVDIADGQLKKEVEYSDKKCPSCGALLVMKWSRKGKFLGCSAFPDCRYSRSLEPPVKCPQCKEGSLIRRKSRRGRYFYGCSKYPQCKYTTREVKNEEK